MQNTSHYSVGPYSIAAARQAHSTMAAKYQYSQAPLSARHSARQPSVSITATATAATAATGTAAVYSPGFLMGRKMVAFAVVAKSRNPKPL